MAVESIILMMGFLFLLIYLWKTIDPKLDWNEETGERILWYNDPLDLCTRKSFTLFFIKKKK